MTGALIGLGALFALMAVQVALILIFVHPPVQSDDHQVALTFPIRSEMFHQDGQR